MGHPAKVAIIGMGLIGSSIARAVKEALPDSQPSGFDIDQRVRARAAELGLAAMANTAAEAVSDADVVILGFGRDHWREALSAWTRFGRGRHPTRLNFGDCLAYATARVANEPLLVAASVQYCALVLANPTV